MEQQIDLIVEHLSAMSAGRPREIPDLPAAVGASCRALGYKAFPEDVEQLVYRVEEVIYRPE